MRKILTITAFIFLTAACSQNSMQSTSMTPEQCKQHCMKMMHDPDMMQKHSEMMKDCPMMQQNKGHVHPTTPPSTSP